MDDKIAAAFAAELAKLRDTYLASLPAELGELRNLAGQLKADDSDRPILKDLHHRLHKLAGSGGTFGLASLSQNARTLEKMAKAWLAEDPMQIDAGAYRLFIDDIARLAGDTDPEPKPLTDPLESESSPTGADVQGNQIWLVEDDPVLGGEISRILSQYGYQVRHFSRVAEAEKMALHGRPDLLILDALFAGEDINLPQQPEKFPNLFALQRPSIFISSQTDFATRAQVAKLGASGFLAKPLDIPKLIDRLEHVLEAANQPPYRILIVDDDIQLAEHYRLVLAAGGMTVEVLNDPARILESVTAFSPELVLMDMHMPQHNGPELAAVIRQHDEWLGLPIVYLSSETDLNEQSKALDRGADDFLTKPISDTQLLAAVRARASRARQIANLMSRDSLTGLLKHTRIKEVIEQEWARTQRNGSTFCVVMIDIDHFKSVNDTYGHAMGDQVIKAVSRLLKQRLRKTDSIGRYGGEEFIAVLPECGPNVATEIMNTLRQHFAALVFHHANRDFSCTLSAGIACSGDLPTKQSGELIIAADEALYEAKHGGRNQVRTASPDTLPRT